MSNINQRISVIAVSYLRPLFEKVTQILTEKIQTTGAEPSDGEIQACVEQAFSTGRIGQSLSLSKLTSADFIVQPQLLDEENLIALTYKPLQGLVNNKIMVHYSGHYPDDHDMPVAEGEIGGEYEYQVICENPDDLSKTTFVNYTDERALTEINRQLSLIKHTTVLYCYINVIRLIKSKPESDLPELEVANG